MPMKIGIVSNSKLCMPLLTWLCNFNTSGLALYLGNSADPGVNKAEIAGFCKGNRIAIHVEDKKEDLYQWQQLFEPDIIFITSYGSKIDAGNLKGVPQGVYNIHFGKLPEFRGPSPIFWQLKNGIQEIGLAIHELSDRFDSGHVVWEHTIRNEDHHNYNYVNQIFSELQIKGVFELLDHISKNIPLNKRIQDEGKAGYSGKPELKHVTISWEAMEAKEIVSLVKACNSWNYGAITMINGFEFKIMDASIIAGQKTKNPPGTVTLDNNNFYVSCIKGVLLSINFFNLNQTYIPARHAGAYGLQTGHKFQSIGY
jgi:methionyl-tRNA formyltransferase